MRIGEAMGMWIGNERLEECLLIPDLSSATDRRWTYAVVPERLQRRLRQEIGVYEVKEIVGKLMNRRREIEVMGREKDKEIFLLVLMKKGV